MVLKALNFLRFVRGGGEGSGPLVPPSGYGHVHVSFFLLSLHLLIFFMYARSEGSGETVHMCRLV